MARSGVSPSRTPCSRSRKRWDVCKAAVLLGRKENVPVYKFLREPLIRKFGEAWYKELEIAAEELEKQGML